MSFPDSSEDNRDFVRPYLLMSLAFALGVYAEDNMIILLCGQKGGVGKSTVPPINSS